MRLSSSLFRPVWVFFFQAEDGIRDLTVTGVQTCALPISVGPDDFWRRRSGILSRTCPRRDRKSTRLNSSHSQISYAVFCLKKKSRPYVTVDKFERIHDQPSDVDTLSLNQHDSVYRDQQS